MKQSPNIEPHYWKRKLFWLTLFGIAMAFLEAAVVVYLRLIYYPEGFSFPLKMIPPNILAIEVLREAATIIMLVAVGWITGQRFLERFAFFAFAFSVWDIFYYIFLKLTINWPLSLFDSDILFLIPVPWIAPVLAPIIVSICLIGASVVVLQRESVGESVKISLIHWIFLILGGVIVIISFLSTPEAVANGQNSLPYNWYIFSLGMLVGLATFVRILRK